MKIDAERYRSYFVATADCLLPRQLRDWFKFETPVFREEAGRAKSDAAVE